MLLVQQVSIPAPTERGSGEGQADSEQTCPMTWSTRFFAYMLRTETSAITRLDIPPCDGALLYG